MKDVASDLLLSVARIEALENDDYEKLPGATYIIGYWRSYANLLGIDISDEIKFHQQYLKIPSAAVVLYPGHLRDHGHLEKSRKRSALLFCLLSVMFLGGIWYWQSPKDNPASQWIESWLSGWLSILNSDNQSDGVISNSGTADSDARSDQGQAIFNISVDEEARAVSILPEPNFSEEFESGRAKLQSKQAGPVQSDTPTGQGRNLQNTVTGESRVAGLQPFKWESGARAASAVAAAIDNNAALLTLTAAENDYQPGASASMDAETRLQASRDAADSGQGPEQNPAESGQVNSGQALQSNADSPDRIVLNIDQQTWLDVRDGKGEKLIYRTVSAGESLELKGSPPFFVFVGVARGARVEYLGRPVEFITHQDEIFARFKVEP